LPPSGAPSSSTYRFFAEFAVHRDTHREVELARATAAFASLAAGRSRAFLQLCFRFRGIHAPTPRPHKRTVRFELIDALVLFIRNIDIAREMVNRQTIRFFELSRPRACATEFKRRGPRGPNRARAQRHAQARREHGHDRARAPTMPGARTTPVKRTRAVTPGNTGAVKERREDVEWVAHHAFAFRLVGADRCHVASR
jgi:hypothetical protein